MKAMGDICARGCEGSVGMCVSSCVWECWRGRWHEGTTWMQSEQDRPGRVATIAMGDTCKRVQICVGICGDVQERVHHDEVQRRRPPGLQRAANNRFFTPAPLLPSNPLASLFKPLCPSLLDPFCPFFTPLSLFNPPAPFSLHAFCALLPSPLCPTLSPPLCPLPLHPHYTPFSLHSQRPSLTCERMRCM